MRPTLENLITIAVLLCATAWFSHGVFKGSPEFEPAIVLIAAFGAVFAKDPIKKRFGWGGAETEHDRALFQRFRTLLPAEPTMRFVREQDFGASFAWKRLNPLIEFVETWGSVDTEFLDTRVEARKKELFAAADKFVSELAIRTAPTSNPGINSVYPDSMRALGPRSPSVIEDAKILNALAQVLAPKYDDFVRYCKGRLAQ